jgi:hypothetical protein
MISDIVRDHLKTSFSTVLNWASSFSEEDRKHLADPVLIAEIWQLCNIDSYFRIRQTTPLILAATQKLDNDFDHDGARFWIHHLENEHGHDAVMRSDIVAMIGDEARANALLEETSMTPPSIALVGFFDWQVRHINPHLLILLRLFLEAFVLELDEEHVEVVDKMIPGGSNTLRLHREADQDHVGDCYDYLDQKFAESDLAMLIWTLDYIALCLRESQSWIASNALGRQLK